MELIDQHTKKIMEGCKERAQDAGLRFQDETLEYIVTNRDLLELSPKVMIPTLYDYWVHDVEVLREKGKYELYPGNPYETVINTRPAISFYNVIEFGRGIDNLVAYHDELSRLNRPPETNSTRRLDFYFDVFLQSEKKLTISEYVGEIESYNKSMKEYGDMGEQTFFSDVDKKYPEFNAIFKKSLEKKTSRKADLLQFIMEHSEFLNKEENKWMISVLELLRKTSLFFQPQIRTKIMNEGWASYWHETLFLQDDRIRGHEVDFARINAGVTSMPRVGLNPYALGMRLFYDIEEIADKGKYSFEFQKLLDSEERKNFDAKTGCGRDFIFKIRENFSDFTFINTFVDQDFVTRNNLFVAGQRLNQMKMVWEYYVKSRKSEDYRKMLMDSLYHPPYIEVDTKKQKGQTLYLVHHFEEKPLVAEFIANTMMGIEYLWGYPVQLETSEVVSISPPRGPREEYKESDVRWRRVLYTMDKRKLSKRTL